MIRSVIILSPQNLKRKLRERYQAWLKQRGADQTFTAEQREWLDRMAEHIGTSLALLGKARG